MTQTLKNSTSEAGLRSVDPLLWVSKEPLPEEYRSLSLVANLDWVVAQSGIQAERMLQTGRFSVILISTDLDENLALDLLYTAKIHQAFSTRLLRANDIHERLVRESINRGQVQQILPQDLSTAELTKFLNQALEKHMDRSQQSQLLRESSRQNRELEALTNSLEQIVEERTLHIEISHKEETEKLSRERLLIRFIKELAAQGSFEDILQVLRKELRKFHKLGDPILAYRFGGTKTSLMSFQGGHFTQTESVIDMPFPDRYLSNHPGLVKHFANHYGRPFIKTLMFPLELKLIRQLAEGGAEAILCFESSLAEKEILFFMEYINDRIGPLSMAFDRVLLENQLSSFSYRWEKTFDSMKDPIAIVDLDFEVVRANKKFLTHGDQERCFQSFAAKKERCQGCPVPQALKEKAPATGQITIGTKTYQVYSYPISVDNGRSTNVVNQYVDITESRQLYLKVLQSEKMGAIGKLAGHIAHELNNPLTGLRSLSQVLLLEAPKGEALYSDLQEIEKAAARSQKIIKNLLEFSHNDTQPMVLISVDEIVEKTLPMLKTALRSHRFHSKMNARRALVQVEPHLLQQVVFNLVNNACQAMKDQGTLTISTAISVPETDGFVELTISDTGPGISKELQDKIFEAFFTTKKEGHGTGLGLSMAKSVVERFGGSIQLESNPGEGASFTIFLPVKKLLT